MAVSTVTQKRVETVAVVGAGITGLAAAYRLARKGLRVFLLEAGNRVGGAIGTLREDGWLCETGPNSLLEGEPALAELLSELGLSGERLEAERLAKNRYIVRGGRLCALPASPPALIRTNLFSAGTKIRLFTEMLQRPRRRNSDVSLATMIADHFGREAVDYGLNPFVSGVYAGDPERLSARHAFPKLWEIEQSTGSIVRGQIAAAKQRRALGRPKPQIISFRNGLQTLTDALAQSLPAAALQLKTRVEWLQPCESGWRIHARGADGAAVEIAADAVCCALPAPALARVCVGRRSDRPMASLEAIEHPPVTSLFLGYRRDQVAHPLDGFGALVPAVEGRKELGILFSSSLFPGRAPEGHVALTVMVGGMRQPELARLEPDAILELLGTDLRELLGVSGSPVYRRCHQWPQAIPQYNLGYEKHLSTIESCEKAHPGLRIGGNARDGIAVPSCLLSGLKMADSLT